MATKPKLHPKPRGGKRAGAGRPEGASNALGYGEVVALRTLKLRVPEGTHEALADVAGEAFERIVAVMRGEIGSFDAGPVLSASRLVREEVCGPVPKKLEHSGPDGGAQVIQVLTFPPETESD